MPSKNHSHHAKRPAPADAVRGEGDGGQAAEAAVLLLESAIEPVARAMGYEIVLIEFAGGRGARIVRVYLDHANGVTLDDCTRMSRIFSGALDAAEADPVTPALTALLATPYVLEVSSPGVDRPLMRLSHFARHVGGRAVVKTKHAIPGGDPDQRNFHGRIVGTTVDAGAADDDRRGTITLRALDGDTIQDIQLVDIRRANLVYEHPATPSGHHASQAAAVDTDDEDSDNSEDADEIDGDDGDDDEAAADDESDDDDEEHGEDDSDDKSDADETSHSG